MKLEPQLRVNMYMKYYDDFDKERDQEVNKSDMSIECKINHQRIIVNIPTIANVLKVYSQLMEVLSDKYPNQLRINIRNKKNLIHCFEGNNDNSTEFIRQDKLIEKIHSNMFKDYS